MTTETLIAHQWQALPGGGGARIYPAIPRFSGRSSNAFLIETGGALVLIDSGGQAEQAALLADLIRDLRRTAPRPVLVLLTHAHFDHFLGLFTQPELLDSRLTVLAVQEDGARALTRADRGLTQAALLEVDLQPLRVDLPLLALGAAGVQGTLKLCQRSVAGGDGGLGGVRTVHPAADGRWAGPGSDPYPGPQPRPLLPAGRWAGVGRRPVSRRQGGRGDRLGP